MAERIAEVVIRARDEASDKIERIQRSLKAFTFAPIEKFANIFKDANFSAGINRVTSGLQRMADEAGNVSVNVSQLTNSMRGLTEWSQRTVEAQVEVQKTLGLIATKINDTILKSYTSSIKLDVDLNDPIQKTRVFNQYLKSIQDDARNWAMGIGEFAKAAPMSMNQYMQQIKQLHSSGLDAIEAKMATRYSAVMSKALESTHADAAYDMARIYNNIKASMPAGSFIDVEAEMKRISSLFDYMDNNFQFKIGKNAVTQIRKSLSIGLARGFTLEDIGISAGFMATRGLEGGMGDTALKEFISRLDVAENKAKKAGYAFSYSFGQSMPQVISNLKSAIGGLSEDDQYAFLKDSFGERGVQAALRLLESAQEISEHVAKVKKSAEGFGQAFNSAFLRSQDYSTALERMNNQLNSYNVGVGRYTAGIRWMFTDLAVSSMRFVAELQNSESAIAQFAGNSISGFATLSGVVTAFGADFIAMSAAPLQFLANIGLAAMAVQNLSSVFAAFMSTRLGTAIAGFGTLTMSVLRNVFSLNFWKTTLISATTATYSFIVNLARMTGQFILLSFASLRHLFTMQFWTKTLWKGIGAGLRFVAITALMVIQFIALKTYQALAALGSVLFWTINTIGALAAAIPMLIVSSSFWLILAGVVALGAGIYLLWKNWDTVWGWIKKSFSGVIEFISGGFKWLWNFADKITFGFLGKLWDGLKMIFGWLWDKLKTLGEWLGVYFDGSKQLIDIESFDSLDVLRSLGSTFDGSSSGGRSSGVNIPQGAYAYAIGGRLNSNSSLEREALSTGTLSGSKSSYPVDTEKDLLRQAVEYLKIIAEKNAENKAENKAITVQKLEAVFPGISSAGDSAMVDVIVNTLSEFRMKKA